MVRLFALALGLTLSACAPVSAPVYLTRAADPSAKVPPISVVDASAGTRSYAPAEPGDWEKINRAVTPPKGQK